MGVKITEVDADTDVTGVEIFPVSDGGSPKRVTATQIKQFVIDQIADITAGTVVVSADKLYLLDATDSAMKPVAIDTIITYIESVLWGNTAESAPDSADLLLLQDGGVTGSEKTVTLALLAEYVRATEQAEILSLATGVDAIVGTPADADTLLISDSGVGKYITYANLKTAFLASLISGQTDIGAAIVDADEIIIDDGGAGTLRRSDVSRLATYMLTKLTADTLAANTDITTNNASASAHGLCPKLPNDVTKFLSGTGTWEVPSNWEGTLTDIDIDGATDIGAAVVGTDLIIVDDGAGGTNRKCAISRLASYMLLNLTADTLAANTDTTTNDATTSLHGLMSKADKVKLDAIEAVADVTDATNVAAAGAVMESDTTTAAMGFVVDEDTLVSDLATKVPTQQSVKAYVDARIPQAVDGTLPTDDNDNFAPTKLVYNKTCSDSDGNDVIDLLDGSIVGQMLTIYLGTKAGTDNAVITPVTALSYSTITLDAVNEIATLQWQGATVGWAILYTNGTVA